MKKLLVILAVVAIILVVGVIMFMRGPDMKQYEHLKEPKISIMQNQKMVLYRPV